MSEPTWEDVEVPEDTAGEFIDTPGEDPEETNEA